MPLDQNELAQRRREAAEPLWAKLAWLEEAGRLAAHLSRAPRVPPPPWAGGDASVPTFRFPTVSGQGGLAPGIDPTKTSDLLDQD